MKKTLLFFVLFIVSCSLYAQGNSLRDVVAVVRPNFGESNITFLNSFADNLQKVGYDSTANYVRNYAKGLSFGSGFAYTDPMDSLVYIITNRHVVVQAQTVNIEFLLADMSVKSYNHCQIVATDEINDLALIALPVGAALSRTLTISNRIPDDGEDVFTAGYPVLSTKPSWQIGKGIISNSNIHIDEWRPTKDGFVQHTAEIDAGSSGGPLLIKSPNSNRGFEVIGMNTWKAIDRQNANFAIKSSTISKFIQEYIQSKQKTGKERLQERANQFLSVNKDGYREILRFISYNYVGKLTVEGFFQLFDASAKEIREKVSDQFHEMLPIEGVRMIIAKTISDKLQMQDYAFAGIENFTETGPVTVLFKKGEETIQTSWVMDQGNWCLSDVSTIHFKDNSMLHRNQRFDYIYYNADFENFLGHLSGSNGLNLNYGFMNSKIRLGVGANFCKIRDMEKTWEYDYDLGKDVEKDYVETYTFGGIQANFGLQRVYSVNQFSIIPYGEVLGNLMITAGFEDKYTGLYAGARLGVDLAYQMSKGSDDCVAVGLAFTSRKRFVGFSDDALIIPALTLNISYLY